MSTQTPAAPSREAVVYPNSDGEPIAENTLQFEWIMTIKGGLDAVFRDDANVFVAGDLLWYPVEGDNITRTAPDAMVALGRPKGYRGSYKQWEEGGIAPQVVFEVLSPGNRQKKMILKFRFYERFGVEEYYVYDPDDNELTGWLRAGSALEPIAEMSGWVSPRLGIRFELAGADLLIYGPDGKSFATYLELAQQRDDMARQRDDMAQQRDDMAQQREVERLRTDRLAAQLRALGVEPER